MAAPSKQKASMAGGRGFYPWEDKIKDINSEARESREKKKQIWNWAFKGVWLLVQTLIIGYV